jgi:hypothetical protein
MDSLPEPWLRGPLAGVSPLFAPAIYALQQTREDLHKHTAGMTRQQVWATPFGLAPLGFQLRHIAGSVDRLSTYLRGESLSESQLSELHNEMNPGADLPDLMADVDSTLGRAEQQIRLIDPATAAEPRYVGRKKLPTTVIGLAVHIAEHTLRHTGQAISAAKLARAAVPSPESPG